MLIEIEMIVVIEMFLHGWEWLECVRCLRNMLLNLAGD